jgi:hypothetical protein
MHRLSFSIGLLAAGLTLAATGASAQYRDPGYRDPRYRQGPNDGYGGDRYGRPQYGGADPASTAQRVMRNLSGAARSAYMDRRERDRFDRAINELQRFEYRWSRERRFDTGNLDRAINHMKHLADARRMDPRMRNAIAQDIDVLRDVRAQRDRYRY